MAKIDVLVNGHYTGSNYTQNSISFGLVATTPSRRLVTDLYTCRDYINDRMIDNLWLRKGDTTNITDGIDFNKLRLIISGKEANKEDIYTGKRIINMYEDLAGWATKSVVTRARLDNLTAWLLTGPEEWMKSSHLVSMVTLIIRIVCNNEGFSKLETLDEVEKLFKEINKTKKEYDSIYSSSDKSYNLPNSYPKFRMLMKKYNELFGELKHSDTMPKNKVGCWHSAGGIVSLCISKTGVKLLDDKISEAWKTWEKDNK